MTWADFKIRRTFEGYWVLHATLDGRPAQIWADQKPQLLAAGVAFVEGRIGDSLPAIDLVVEGAGLQTLSGFTNDPKLVTAARRLVAFVETPKADRPDPAHLLDDLI